MRLVSFELKALTGTATRIGAVLSDGRYADLQSAYRAHLAARTGASAEGAARLAAATIPTDMVAFIENGEAGLNAARAALDWATANGETGPDGARLVHDPKSVRLLSPLPRPPLIRDFMAFEQHLKNIFPKLGRRIPPQWYELPVYYKGNPSAVGAGRRYHSPPRLCADARLRVRVRRRDRARRRRHPARRSDGSTFSAI